MEHSMNHKGEKMSITDVQTHRLKIFYVKVSQDLYEEKDVTKNCVNYPNDEYETYTDCD